MLAFFRQTLPDAYLNIFTFRERLLCLESEELIRKLRNDLYCQRPSFDASYFDIYGDSVTELYKTLIKKAEIHVMRYPSMAHSHIKALVQEGRNLKKFNIEYELFLRDDGPDSLFYRERQEWDKISTKIIRSLFRTRDNMNALLQLI
jgi:hypothetical protein